MPVLVFCYFCISEKLFWKYSRNWTKPGQDLLFFQHVHEVRRRDGGDRGGRHTLGRRGPPPTAPWWGVGPSGRSSRRPFAYLFIFTGNARHPSHYPRKVPETPPPSTLTREGSEALPGTLSETGIITGGLYIAMPASGVMRE